MRLLMLAALLGGSLHAQEATPPETGKLEQQEPAVAPDNSKPFSKLPENLKLKLQEARKPEYWKLEVRKAGSASQGPCSIPLKNVIPQPPKSAELPSTPYVDSPFRTKVYPIPQDRFATRYAPLPAPPCDDGKR